MAALARLMLFLALCVGVTVSAVVDLQKRIIGGRDCDRPYHVRLENGGALLCGGSLISDKWILTAAHCKRNGDMFAFLSDDRLKGLKITETPVIYTDTNKKSHDIMLLKLSTATSILPVPLPDKGDCPKVGDTVELAGYASTVGSPGDLKKIGESPVLKCADFEVVYGTGPKKVKITATQTIDISHEHHFSGKTSSGTDACLGDSGGGVEYNNKIVGVLSTVGELVCMSSVNFMDICNDIANNDNEYLSWIKKTIQN